jgi:glycosyltransferase involved in cell wall biosynthesis
VEIIVVDGSSKDKTIDARAENSFVETKKVLSAETFL